MLNEKGGTKLGGLNWMNTGFWNKLLLTQFFHQGLLSLLVFYIIGHELELRPYGVENNLKIFSLDLKHTKMALYVPLCMREAIVCTKIIIGLDPLFYLI